MSRSNVLSSSMVSSIEAWANWEPMSVANNKEDQVVVVERDAKVVKGLIVTATAHLRG